jgi:hypothetical protein
MTSLVDHVRALRTLAILDPDTTLLQTAMLDVMEEMAEALDGLRGRFPRDDTDPPEHGLGSI